LIFAIVSTTNIPNSLPHASEEASKQKYQGGHFWTPITPLRGQFCTPVHTLAIEHPDARLLFSGGSGRLRNTVIGRPTVHSVAVDFIVSLGIDPDRTNWEEQSQNTAENARFSYDVAGPAPGET
ncbi:YdcF family protein, partial [Aquicoccus porphyridii]|uniref:YdcF family protein n=1 Tax=Aquicoccus porphyridii TaxID=1852029 RepID=UPI00165E7DC8